MHRQLSIFHLINTNNCLFSPLVQKYATLLGKKMANRFDCAKHHIFTSRGSIISQRWTSTSICTKIQCFRYSALNMKCEPSGNKTEKSQSLPFHDCNFLVISGYNVFYYLIKPLAAQLMLQKKEKKRENQELPLKNFRKKKGRSCTMFARQGACKITEI